MKTFTKHICWPLVVAILCSTAHMVLAGGHRCHHCGGKEDVKTICRLVMVCKEVDIPSYAYTKEEVFHPDKGAVCHASYRCDTFYDFWRDCDCQWKGKQSVPVIYDPLQTSQQRGLPLLNCSCHTVCGCQTLYGAKSTGCHVGCAVRKAVGNEPVTVPILRWETVHLCKACCDSRGRKK